MKVKLPQLVCQQILTVLSNGTKIWRVSRRYTGVTATPSENTREAMKVKIFYVTAN